MKYYDKRISALNTDFKSTIIDDESVNKHIELMLTNLGVPKSEWNNYFGHDLTVYDCLLKLSQGGHLQITWLVELIDKKERLNKMAIATGLLLPAGIAAAILYSPPLEGVLTSIKAFFASADSLPILGIVKTTLFSSYNLYRIFSDIKQPLFNRWRDASVVIAKAAASYVGYALWLLSAVTMTPVVAALFAVSSLLDLGKEVFCLVQEVIQHKKMPAGCEGDVLNTQRTKIRHEIGYKTHLNAAIINLVTAVAVVGIMAAWTFAPGGIVVMLSCLAALAVVYGIRYIALRHNASVMRDTLQTQLANAETEYLESKTYTSELELVDVFNNAPGNSCDPAPAPADRLSSVPRQIVTPSASSLPFFAHSSKSDETEELTAGQSLNCYS